MMRSPCSDAKIVATAQLIAVDALYRVTRGMNRPGFSGELRV